MTVVLDKDVEDLIAKQAALHGGSAEALVNDALRSVWSQQPPWKEWPLELENWLLEATDSPVTELTSADYEGIRAKARERLGAAAA